jgi:hypothetical protein
MKNLIHFLILALVLVTSSCQKETITPNVPEEQVIDEIRLYGKWLLVGGSMYVTNLETGQKVKYDHFGPNKTISSLDYNGSDIEIEAIELNTTTWSFYAPPAVPGYGEFVLNGATYAFLFFSHIKGLSLMSSNFLINLLFIGTLISSIPFTNVTLAEVCSLEVSITCACHGNASNSSIVRLVCFN